jgi:hypothetical protein
MIYGDTAYLIEDDSTDRIGIRTLVISKLWVPSRWTNGNFGDLDDEVPSQPTVPAGMSLLIGRRTRRASGALRTYWTFEGVNGDGKSVTFKTRDNTLDYGFEPGFSQVDIKLHPDFDKFEKKYGAFVDSDGRVVWSRTIGGGVNTSGLGLGGGNSGGGSVTSLGLGASQQGQLSEGSNNPLFGYQDWLRMEGTYTCRYASFDLAAANVGVGGIFSAGQLPGIAPGFAGRNYLKTPTVWQRRGPVYDATETYWLSGPGGWEPLIYRASTQR